VRCGLAHPQSEVRIGAIQQRILKKISVAMREATEGRRLTMTKSGYLSLSPADTRRGDTIAILFDCDAPVLLRPIGKHYEFVGTCYVHGIMQGEAMNEPRSNDSQTCTFEIR